MNSQLSIIVVTFNEARHIARLKCAIDGLTTPESLAVETVLIDGGSSDNTCEIARDLEFTKVIELPGASIPVCRNRGIQEATGNWIAFVDGDCEPAQNWLMEAIPWLESPDPVIIGWPVTPPENGTWVQKSWHIHWAFKNQSAGGATEPVHEQAFRLITTRNMLLNREVLKVVERFDDQLLTGEDTDFVFRAYMGGVKVVGVPSLRVIHHGEPTGLREFFCQQLWHANRSAYQRIMKESGGKVGGNAPRFTVLFLLSVLAFAGGIISALISGSSLPLVLLLPLLAVITGPALLIAHRAKKPRAFMRLSILYAAYGLARSLDLLGFARGKRSWKN